MGPTSYLPASAPRLIVEVNLGFRRVCAANATVHRLASSTPVSRDPSFTSRTPPRFDVAPALPPVLPPRLRHPSVTPVSPPRVAVNPTRDPRPPRLVFSYSKLRAADLAPRL